MSSILEDLNKIKEKLSRETFFLKSSIIFKDNQKVNHIQSNNETLKENNKILKQYNCKYINLTFDITVIRISEYTINNCLFTFNIREEYKTNQNEYFLDHSYDNFLVILNILRSFQKSEGERYFNQQYQLEIKLSKTQDYNQILCLLREFFPCDIDNILSLVKLSKHNSSIKKVDNVDNANNVGDAVRQNNGYDYNYNRGANYDYNY